MSDTGLTWQDDAPSQAPGPFESEAWNNDNVGNAAMENELVGAGANVYNTTSDAVTGTVSDFQAIEGITDWDGIATAVGNLEGNISGVADAASAFGEVVSGIKANPIEWLAGSIVDFLMSAFQPLDDLVQMVSGNEERMLVSGEMWVTVADGCNQVGQYIIESGLAAMPTWQGQDANAAKTRITEAGNAISNMGFVAQGMNLLLGLMAKVAKALYEEVVNLLKEGVEYVLTRIAAYIAASWATLGAAVPVAVGDTIRKVCQLVMRAYEWIKKAMAVFEKAKKAIDVITTIIEKIKPVIDFLMGAKQVYDGAMSLYENREAIMEGVSTALDGAGQVLDGAGQVLTGDVNGGVEAMLDGAHTTTTAASDTLGTAGEGLGGITEGLGGMSSAAGDANDSWAGGNSSTLSGLENATSTAEGWSQSAQDRVETTQGYVDDATSRIEGAQGVQEQANNAYAGAQQIADGIESGAGGNYYGAYADATNGAGEITDAYDQGRQDWDQMLGNEPAPEGGNQNPAN